jgi:rSAM/selenodomain-associated transferase 1
MANAFKQGFSEAYDKIIIIGSDLYDLTSDIILEAFERLDSNDVVLGPATDGGYYLLGMKELIPSIFQNKEWGTPSVFSSTLKDIDNKKVFLTKELNDIDVVKDMENHPVLNSFL